MDAKLTENVIFVRGTGKDFVLQLITLTFIYTQIIFVVLYMPNVWNSKRKRNAKISTGTILCCLATASDKKYHNFDDVRQIPIIRAYI